jgi:CRP-like cAMP-binding protein
VSGSRDLHLLQLLLIRHSAPRAASIISITPCTLWALDRVSFRTILLDVRLLTFPKGLDRC